MVCFLTLFYLSPCGFFVLLSALACTTALAAAFHFSVSGIAEVPRSMNLLSARFTNRAGCTCNSVHLLSHNVPASFHPPVLVLAVVFASAICFRLAPFVSSFRSLLLSFVFLRLFLLGAALVRLCCLGVIGFLGAL